MTDEEIDQMVEDIENALDDSMDYDWNTGIGARCVVRDLNEKGYKITVPGADPLTVEEIEAAISRLQQVLKEVRS